jgi:hypothetical protein
MIGEKLINMDNIVDVFILEPPPLQSELELWSVVGEIPLGEDFEMITLYVGAKEECELFFESLKRKVVEEVK